MPRNYWRDKSVLVAGGSSGLGLALVRRLAAEGASVTLGAVDDANLAAARDAFRGADVEAVAADVTSGEQAQRLTARAAARRGRLDALFHCVGRSTRGEILATPADAFRELIELNFLTAVHCVRAAAPALLASRGHIVLVGSLAAKSASRFLGAYPASKFPLAAYAQQLRLELGPRGVHTLLVCPGPIARPDAGRRYDAQAAGLPEAARRPGGGVRLRGLSPEWLVGRILRACERRRAELVAPARARLLFAVSQLSPRLGDWVVRRMSA